MIALLGLREPLTGDLEMTVELFPPDRRRRDMDNTLKALQDSLQHGKVYEDDCQISVLHMFRREMIKPAGKCRVTLKQI